MKDQHETIAGYRDLTQSEIDAINEFKAVEGKIAEWFKLIEPADADAMRWLEIAREHLETGFMYAIKAIARPTNGLGHK